MCSSSMYGEILNRPDPFVMKRVPYHKREESRRTDSCRWSSEVRGNQKQPLSCTCHRVTRFMTRCAASTVWKLVISGTCKVAIIAT